MAVVEESDEGVGVVVVVVSCMHSAATIEGGKKRGREVGVFLYYNEETLNIRTKE